MKGKVKIDEESECPYVKMGVLHGTSEMVRLIRLGEGVETRRGHKEQGEFSLKRNGVDRQGGGVVISWSVKNLAVCGRFEFSSLPEGVETMRGHKKQGERLV